MATFGVAFVARPFGSILFGHFGDRMGRKATLIGSLLLMGLATFAVGLGADLPPDRIAGASSSCDFAFQSRTGARRGMVRAALLAAETAEPGKRAQAAMWPQLGAPFGFLLANGFFF